jgi:hypothetical protein
MTPQRDCIQSLVTHELVGLTVVAVLSSLSYGTDRAMPEGTQPDRGQVPARSRSAIAATGYIKSLTDTKIARVPARPLPPQSFSGTTPNSVEFNERRGMQGTLGIQLSGGQLQLPASNDAHLVRWNGQQPPRAP